MKIKDFNSSLLMKKHEPTHKEDLTQFPIKDLLMRKKWFFVLEQNGLIISSTAVSHLKTNVQKTAGRDFYKTVIECASHAFTRK